MTPREQLDHDTREACLDLVQEFLENAVQDRRLLDAQVAISEMVALLEESEEVEG